MPLKKVARAEQLKLTITGDYVAPEVENQGVENDGIESATV
jgi:hypothetical protein